MKSKYKYKLHLRVCVCVRAQDTFLSSISIIYILSITFLGLDNQ